MTDKKQIINKAIIILLIIWLLFSVFTFFYFKNKCEIAKENPLKYGARKYDITQCSCFTTSGENLFFNQTKVWKIGR